MTCGFSHLLYIQHTCIHRQPLWSWIFMVTESKMWLADLVAVVGFAAVHEPPLWTHLYNSCSRWRHSHSQPLNDKTIKSALWLVSSACSFDTAGLSTVRHLISKTSVDLDAFVPACYGTVPTCDRQTDRQTHNDSKCGASIASRGKYWQTWI